MIQQKFPRVGLLLRFSKGKIHYFVIAFIASMFGTVFDFLTPQVIRITVDSVIGDKPFSLPAFFAEKVDLNAVRELFRTNLLWCAGFILLFSILSGLCTYIRITINAKGAEGMIRRMRDAALQPYSETAVSVACAASDGGYHPAVHDGCGSDPQLYCQSIFGYHTHHFFDCVCP